jgi:HK97 family phage portal protein
VYEVCRWIGVDPIFVYEYGRATWNNAEAQTRNFLQFSLNPWLRRWETEVGRKLLRPEERGQLYAEFTREAVVQLDIKTQSDVWAAGVSAGWYTVDEVRGWLNLPPLPPETDATTTPTSTGVVVPTQTTSTTTEETNGAAITAG